MPFYHRLLAATYYPRGAIMTIGRSLGLSRADSLRVLLYHDIAPEERARFARQLRWLAQSWKFVSASQFGRMILGEEPVQGRNVLLTFDDGFASNRIVAEEILNPMGIRALFFVVSDFVALNDRRTARCFIARNILPGADEKDFPAHWSNMNWADLEALLEQGHTVGAHTRTHARLAQVNSEDELEREIIGAADMLEQRLSCRVEHFAYSFGNLANFSRAALQVARRRFRFVHSGLRGENAANVSPLALRRDAATPRDSCALVGAFLQGGADFRYAVNRARLDAWTRMS